MSGTLSPLTLYTASGLSWILTAVCILLTLNIIRKQFRKPYYDRTCTGVIIGWTDKGTVPKDDSELLTESVLNHYESGGPVNGSEYRTMKAVWQYSVDGTVYRTFAKQWNGTYLNVTGDVGKIEYRHNNPKDASLATESDKEELRYLPITIGLAIGTAILALTIIGVRFDFLNLVACTATFIALSFLIVSVAELIAFRHRRPLSRCDGRIIGFRRKMYCTEGGDDSRYLEWTFVPVVEYTVGGQTYQINGCLHDSAFNLMHVGFSIGVYYDRDDPQNATTEKERPWEAIVLLLASIMLVLIATGLIVIAVIYQR